MTGINSMISDMVRRMIGLVDRVLGLLLGDGIRCDFNPGRGPGSIKHVTGLQRY